LLLAACPTPKSDRLLDEKPLLSTNLQG